MIGKIVMLGCVGLAMAGCVAPGGYPASPYDAYGGYAPGYGYPGYGYSPGFDGGSSLGFAFEGEHRHDRDHDRDRHDGDRHENHRDGGGHENHRGDPRAPGVTGAPGAGHPAPAPNAPGMAGAPAAGHAAPAPHAHAAQPASNPGRGGNQGGAAAHSGAGHRSSD
jgi:hypothetical protein